jgi:hypothetical protein
MKIYQSDIAVSLRVRESSEHLVDGLVRMRALNVDGSSLWA